MTAIDWVGMVARPISVTSPKTEKSPQINLGRSSTFELPHLLQTPTNTTSQRHPKHALRFLPSGFSNKYLPTVDLTTLKEEDGWNT